MKPSDIERLIHICAKLNVARIKLKSGEVELSLDFASVFKGTDAQQNVTRPGYMGLDAAPTPIASERETLAEKLFKWNEQQARERQGKQPGTYMSDIELAMNPPRDLREAMEAAPLDIVVPGEPGIAVSPKLDETEPGKNVAAEGLE